MIMSTQTLTVPVPDSLLVRLTDRARQANRSVEAEVLDVLSTALSANAELPADLAEALSALDQLDEPGLRRAADSRLSAEAAAELEALHLKQRREGLTATEELARQDLMRQYERAMLIRARATALLHGRNRNGPAPAAP
jgi:plasmid stability protein